MSGLVKQWAVDDVEVSVFADKAALGAAAAEHVAGLLRAALEVKGEAAIILATGASQYEFLDALRTVSGLDWRKVTAFHLDEYLGISPYHPASFRRYLKERVFDHITFANFYLLNGDAPDAQAEARRYAALLSDHVIDVACVGIGENGHLAFNDPPADFNAIADVLILDLDEKCRMQQVGEGHFAGLEDVPPQAFSLSIPAIMRSRAISCVVPDARKAEAVRATLQNPIAPTIPASILRQHEACRLFLDPDSAALL